MRSVRREAGVHAASIDVRGRRFSWTVQVLEVPKLPVAQVIADERRLAVRADVERVDLAGEVFQLGHEPQVGTVQSNCELGAIVGELVQHGQHLAVADPAETVNVTGTLFRLDGRSVAAQDRDRISLTSSKQS